MKRSAWFSVAAGVFGILVFVGCESMSVQKESPYASEQGLEVTFDQTPREVQKFVTASYPNARVEHIYEMRHRKEYRMRHFEIHLVLEGGRKKTIDYNTFVKTTPGVQQLQSQEVSGNGTRPAAQPRGEMEGQAK